MPERTAKVVVDSLLMHGVEYIFAIPGAKIDSVFDALLDSPIKIILCRHEQNAAFMAAAYGRLTGKAGVVLVTSGPGVANLATGLLTATTEGDPIVALGGNVSRSMALKESHQNTNNVKLMETVTKKSMDVLMGENVPEIIENAFRIAQAPRKGAVFVSFPQDVLSTMVSIPNYTLAPAIQYGSAPDSEIQAAASLINQAKLPVLLLGQEASCPMPSKAIRELLQKSGFPTVSTYQAAGVVPRSLLSCFVGRIGLFKNQPGDKLLDQADVVLTIGYNPVEYDPILWNGKRNKKIIHLDYRPTNIDMSYTPCLEIIGDISANIKCIMPLIEGNILEKHKETVQALQDSLHAKIKEGASHKGFTIHPLRFIHDLRQVIDDNSIITCDIGSHAMWLARYFLTYEPHRLLFSNGQQTLGVAMPWAMAARLSDKSSSIISISGDGGFLFSATELETAVREKLNFVHCIWCDGSYDMVKQQQLQKYKRDCAVTLGSLDYVKFAESFGAVGFRVSHSDDLIKVLREAMSCKGPVLVEIPIDYSENPVLFQMAHEDIGH